MKSFETLKKKMHQLNYGREIIMDVVRDYAIGLEKSNVDILDIGAGPGIDLLNCRATLEKINMTANMYGIENYGPSCDKLRASNINVTQLDIESDIFPWNTDMFDIIIMNQCLEHTKEVFWIFSEISRVLRIGGICIVGVPNLASLHNRLLLLIGKHPTSIRMFGPHVRGITSADFIRFAEKGGWFKCLKWFGSNFYPFPTAMAKLLSRIFPNMSVSLFFVLQRTEKQGVFSEVLRDVFFETPFKVH